jgi:hypothetical protein
VVDLAQVANVASPFFRPRLELDLAGRKVDAPTGDLLGSLPECRHLFVRYQILHNKETVFFETGNLLGSEFHSLSLTGVLSPWASAAFAPGCRIRRLCWVSYIVGFGKEVSNVG